MQKAVRNYSLCDLMKINIAHTMQSAYNEKGRAFGCTEMIFFLSFKKQNVSVQQLRPSLSNGRCSTGLSTSACINWKACTVQYSPFILGLGVPSICLTVFSCDLEPAEKNINISVTKIL